MGLTQPHLASALIIQDPRRSPQPIASLGAARRPGGGVRMQGSLHVFFSRVARPGWELRPCRLNVFRVKGHIYIHLVVDGYRAMSRRHAVDTAGPRTPRNVG